MDEIQLGVPQPLLDSLPEDGASAGQDMQCAVDGYNAQMGRATCHGRAMVESTRGVAVDVRHCESR